MGDFMAGWFTGVVALMILGATFNTSDKSIVSGKKIKIDNAVYECKQTQKLDLGEK